MLFGPTFAEMRDPGLVDPAVREKAREARSRPLDPLNLWNLSWKADGAVPFTVLPEALTGVRAPIVVLSGRHFPTGSHKVGPAYSILVEKQLDAVCAPGEHTLVFPSTGNFGIGGAWVGPRMGYRSRVVLPEEMSAERFEKIRGYGADVIATPGSESNVKEIYDKVRELRADPAEPDPEPVRGDGELPLPLPLHRGRGREVVGALGLEAGAFVSAMGSAGTIAAGEGLRRHHPGLRVVAVEPMQCPTLYNVGFGAHRIEGIGDKHVTWIHNVWATDLLVCIDDLECLEGLQLLQEGQATLEAEGVDPERARSWVDLFGMSGVCNVLAAIRAGATTTASGRGRRSSRWRPTASTATRRSCGVSTASRGRWTPEKAQRRVEIFRSRRTGWLARGHARGAPALAQPEVLHLGGAAGQDRRGAAGPGGPGVVGGPAGAGARHRPPHPGEALLSFPGCVSGLVCVRCGRRYARGLDGPCAACGPEGVLEIEFDLARARRTLTPRALRSRPRNAWRYEELLPVTPGARRPALEPGWTPILDTPRLARVGGRAAAARQGRGPQPDRLVQGPGERRGRRPRPLPPGEGRGLRLDRQRGHVAGRRRGQRGPAVRHLRPRVRARAQGGAAPRLRGAGLPRSRQLRRHLGDVPAGVRPLRLVQPQRRREPDARRGQEDGRPRDRRAVRRRRCRTGWRCRSGTAARSPGSARGSPR